MIENNSGQFKIRLDDDSEEESFDEKENITIVTDTKNKTPDRRRVVLIAIIIGLIGVVSALAYIDIKRRIDIIQASGNTQVTSLSQDLRTKLSDLTTESESVKKILETEITSLKKEINTLSNALDNRIKDLKNSENSEKNKLENTVASLNKQISQFNQNTKSIDNRFAAIEKTIKQEVTKLDDIISGIKKDMETTKSDLSQSEKKRVEQEKAILAFDLQQKRTDKDIEQIQKYIDNRFSKIEKRVQVMENSRTPSAVQTRPPQAVTPTAPAPSTSAGNLIEQDISE